MTTATTAIRRPPRWLTQMLSRPANVLPALVWLFLVFVQIAYAVEYPGVPTFGLIAINVVALILFVTRRDASRVGAFWEGALAVLGTFVVSLLLLASNSGGATLHDAPALPTAIQCAGLAGWGMSLVALGRSLGIAPADRGLVRHGPYRYVRHPIYAFEGLFFLGWLVAYPTIGNAGVLAIWAGLQIARIMREEKILGGYEEYRRAVRWRLLPFVW